jgi:hypothetical protein
MNSTGRSLARWRANASISGAASTAVTERPWRPTGGPVAAAAGQLQTVEDWLADILEAQAVETGALEEARGGFGIAERERVRTRRGWLRRFTERAIDRLRPFVVLAPLPDEQHQSRAGSHGCGDVRERGARIGEKHRAEAADHHVECTGRELMRLGIAYLVYDVADPLGHRRVTGSSSMRAEMSTPTTVPAQRRALPRESSARRRSQY